MKKASDYRRHAEECRALASSAALPEHRDQLLEMAHTWDMLAQQREAELARQERIAALTTNGNGNGDGNEKK
jgi:hypothetical protein